MPVKSLGNNENTNACPNEIIVQSVNTEGGDEEEVIQLQYDNLKPIGIVGSFSIFVGIVMGSGIFISVSETLAFASPSFGILMVLWIVGGILSLCGALSYAQLGIMVKKSGGDLTYFSEAFGHQIGVVYVYIFSFFGDCSAISVLSLTFGKYFVILLRGDYKNNILIERLVAAFLIWTVLLVNIINKNIAMKIQIVFSSLNLISLAVISIVGVYLCASGKVFNAPNPFKEPFRFDKLNMRVLDTTLINILWSYEGWNCLGTVTGEIRNPQRDLPISAGLGIVLIILLYCLTITAYVAALGYANVQNTVAVAAAFTDAVLPKCSWTISLAICLTALGAANASLIAVSRVIMTSGIQRWIPPIFGLVEKKRRTPVVSLITVAFLSSVYLTLELQTILRYCAFCSWSAYGTSMVALFVLNRRRRKKNLSFRVPMVIPSIVILVSVFMVVSCIRANPVASSVLLATIITICGIHFLPERYLHPPPLVKAHNKVLEYLKEWYDLTLGDESDIS